MNNYHCLASPYPMSWKPPTASPTHRLPYNAVSTRYHVLLFFYQHTLSKVKINIGTQPNFSRLLIQIYRGRKEPPLLFRHNNMIIAVDLAHITLINRPWVGDGLPWHTWNADCTPPEVMPLAKISPSFGSRVSKSHGFTVVRLRNIFLTLRKILRFACAN